MDIQVGQRVVYPAQGICRVEGTEELSIGPHRQEFLRLLSERDNTTVRVPVTKVEEVGLRPLASPPEAERALTRLGDQTEEPTLDWKTRQREHQEKMTRGGLLGLAEVLRSLFTLSLMRPLPQRERELYDKVRALMVEEISATLGMTPMTIEDQMDLALAPPEGRGEAQRRLRARAAERQIEAAARNRSGDGTGEAATKKAATKKAATKKATTKKATTKKATAKKATAKKATAKKATAKKASAKQTSDEKGSA